MQKTKFHIIPYFEQVSIGDTWFTLNRLCFQIVINTLTHNHTNTNIGSYNLHGSVFQLNNKHLNNLRYFPIILSQSIKTFSKECYIEFGGIICIHEQRNTFCTDSRLYFNFCCFLYVPAHTTNVIKPILKVMYSTAAQNLALYKSTVLKTWCVQRVMLHLKHTQLHVKIRYRGYERNINTDLH